MHSFRSYKQKRKKLFTRKKRRRSLPALLAFQMFPNHRVRLLTEPWSCRRTGLAIGSVSGPHAGHSLGLAGSEVGVAGIV